MTDPITAVTTFVTLATFIKDLLELGKNIDASIKKVGENQRHLKELTKDVLRTLNNLANLTRGQEDEFQAPALLTALGNLKGVMLVVLSGCRDVTPIEQSPRLRRLKTQVKAWWNRDEIEARIRCLRKQVNACYDEFELFSIARTEKTAAQIHQTATQIENTTDRIDDTVLQLVNTSLRVEQTLIINAVENQVRLERLGGLMLRVQLNERFGRDFTDQTIEIICCDRNHQSLESKYLAGQATHLVDSVQQLLSGNDLDFESPDWDPTITLVLLKNASPSHTLYKILHLLLHIEHHNRSNVSTTDIVKFGLDLGIHLSALGFHSQATGWELVMNKILHQVAQMPGNHCTAVIPYLATSMRHLSQGYSHISQHRLALETSRRSLDLFQLSSESSPDVDNRISYVSALIVHSQNLLQQRQELGAISVAQEAVRMCRPVIDELESQTFKYDSPALAEAEYKAVCSSEAFFCLAFAYRSAKQIPEAFHACKEAFQTVLKYSRAGLLYAPARQDIRFFHKVLADMISIEGQLRPLFADSVHLFGHLGHIYPQEIAGVFLQFTSAYVYLAQSDGSENIRERHSKLKKYFMNNRWNPKLCVDITRTIEIDQPGRIIRDIIHAWFAVGGRAFRFFGLIRFIFSKHCDEAATALQENIISMLATNPAPDTIQWTLLSIHVFAIQFAHLKKAEPQRMIAKILSHIHTKLGQLSPDVNYKWTLPSLRRTCLSCLLAGSLNAASLAARQAIGHLRSSSLVPRGDADDDVPNLGLRHWLLCQALVEFDMGRFAEANSAAREASTLFPPQMSITEDAHHFFLWGVLQFRTLRFAGWNKEALWCIGDVVRKLERAGGSSGSSTLLFQFDLSFACAELAVLQLECGNTEQALEAAHTAAQALGISESDEHKFQSNGPRWSYYEAHIFDVLSICFSVVGEEDRALDFAQRAVELKPHITSASDTFHLPILRKEEVVGNALYYLSIRLVISGRLEEALLHAEEAIGFYRDLVVLAANHLPSLASGLQHSASVLWTLGRWDESLATLEEAVGVRQALLNHGPHFLPALTDALHQLTAYRSEQEKLDTPSVRTSECEEVRKKSLSFPQIIGSQTNLHDYKMNSAEFRTDLHFSHTDYSGTDSDADFQEYDCDSDGSDVDSDPDFREYANSRDYSPDLDHTECDPDSDNLDYSPNINNSTINITIATMIVVHTTENPRHTPAVTEPLRNNSPTMEQESLGASHDDTPPLDEDPPPTDTIPGKAADVGNTGEPRLKGIPNMPLQIQVNSRSMPMDILWWVLVGIIGVACAVMWSQST